MFDKLKSIFDKKIEEENEQFDTVQIAISTLMIQTAVYDGIFDEKEKSEILELIKKYFELTEDQKLSLFKIAMKVNDNSNDMQQFTRVLNTNLSEDEKLNIIEMLWKIIISDGHIDDYENALIRKISGLLYISDRDVGRIKKELIEQQ
ncbi:uncharacterized protein METZ01_LOCUS168355 [marine metagenome]|jgi:uncharacterized tellurite resistance protein B-like protein|uniref:Co-chaperone DjlA N-terminal domain-containing protein n=1 Tax=marine metagenome TaxID=408172 RepID=A0A382BPN5_9ZZZZ|tara:strand:- start:145 stop:588 length:444 start_codon:yes stop_codon:yes gene_type:complete